MRKIRIAGTLLTLLAAWNLSFGQDFSNKGKDFWVGYGYHERMNAGGGGSQNMVLYFATEAITNVRVEVPGTGYVQNYTIPANTIFTSNPIPKSGAQDARLDREGVLNRGIHITSDKPIVAYAHIYNMNVSGATLLFPTNTLGKEYYSINADQVSNSNNANSWFYAIAVDPGITTVEITPSQNTLTRTAGVPFTVNLQQGQVINMMGILTGNFGDEFRGVDLTGSRIRSVSSGTEGCKRLAVFSGSGRIALICPGVGNTQKSSDNYMVQAFPKTAWGKTYLTVPTELLENNMFRIAVEDPSTIVRVNGQVMSPLINNFYYEVGPLNRPAKIEADKPVMVAQYISSAGNCGNTRSGELGDPEVIYLSPVEQTINRVILNSTPNHQILQHFINVTIPSGGTAISSFRLDGAAQGGFVPHPQNPDFAYARFQVNPGQHILQSDSGFSAIAYGYGNYESYGYNAGANVKDLYQFVTVDNEFASVDFPAACKSAPFGLSISFPYQPTRIAWQFNGLFADVSNDNPVPSSTSVVNGRTIYSYKLPGSYTANTPGTYPIRVIAENPTADGCNGVQEIDYDLEIFDQPNADFSFSTNGCVSSPVSFTGAADNTGGRPLQSWFWDFGDGNTDQSGANVAHTYAAASSYQVKYAVLTDVGCKSDTAIRTVELLDPPIADFDIVDPACAGKPVLFNDGSSAPSGSNLVKWIWNFGDGTPVVTVNNNNPQSHSFATPGTYTISLQVETASGCLSQVFTRSISIHPNPVVDFNLPAVVCLPGGEASFISQSSISDGTESQFTYSWNFGDGAAPAAVANPTHQFSATGPFNISLQVTSGAGCSTTATKLLQTIYEEPQAAFQADAEICFGDTLQLTDQSSAAGATITGWTWDFGDGTGSTMQNPQKLYSAPGRYTVTLRVVSDKGCQSVTRIATQEIEVMALPVADFVQVGTACVGREIWFRDNASTASGTLIQWNWTFGNNGTGQANQPGHQIGTIYNQVTDFIVGLQVLTDKGCISQVKRDTVTVHPNPVASFEAASICVNDRNAPFVDASTVSTGSISTWHWNFGDPNANANNPNTANTAQATHHYTLPGTYTSTLIAGSAAGCYDTTQRTFNVNGAVLTPSFIVDNNNTVCSNQELILRDQSQIDAGRIIRVEISWDMADPSALTIDESPFPGKQYTHRYPVFSSPASKQYRIRYRVFSGIDCVDSFEDVVTVLASPQITMTAVSPICSDAPSLLLSASVANNLPGAGLFSGPGTSGDGIFNPGLAGAGLHQLYYQYTAGNGCTEKDSIQVIVNPTPIAEAGPDKVVLEGGEVTLTPVLITDYPVSYTWSPATGLSDSSIAMTIASPAMDMVYQLRIESEFGCSSTDEVAVKLLKMPVIPNIFSPNGDGINDRWVIPYLETYPGSVIQLFNRYGQLVHRIVNYSSPWDGRISGRDAPVGTYYYIIDPRNGRKPMTGFVDIIR